jgi:glycosyltransferase involved in cell wall biosynthesis
MNEFNPTITSGPQFVVAATVRNPMADHARVLARFNLLRCYALWTRRGSAGVPPELTRLLTPLGLLAYIGARTLSPFYGETFRWALYPIFDQWVRWQLRAGDHLIATYANANACLAWVRRHGGKTFLAAGNSHPETCWEILEEEHRRWKCPYPPAARFYHERSRRSVELADYVFSPSSFVRNSFLAHGFKPEQILEDIYLVDFSHFQPPNEARPAQRPFTIINTGMLCLRKGTPYLLEAFRLIRKEVPDVRFLLTDAVMDNVKPIMTQYGDLPIEWAPSLPKDKLAERLRSADLFILPSLEEGLVRTAQEAMACGLPVILTPNTGANDFVTEGVNGSVIPIRNPQAIRDTALVWWERIRGGYRVPTVDLQSRVSYERLENTFIGHLRKLGLLSAAIPGSGGENENIPTSA